MKRKEYCYWCGKTATSREHVPPKCFFPERKDMSELVDEDFRNNLITVPSCDLHNLSKSNDDEYLMACLSSRFGNNGVAYLHTVTKGKRMRTRNPKMLDVVNEGKVRVGNTMFPVQIIEIDNQKMMKSLEAIARALYYHEFHNSFNVVRCMVLSDIFLQPKDCEYNTFAKKSIKLIEDEQPNWNTEEKIIHSKIFSYQHSPIDGFGTITFRLEFYEKTTIYVLLIPEIDESKKRTLSILSKAMFAQ